MPPSVVSDQQMVPMQDLLLKPVQLDRIVPKVILKGERLVVTYQQNGMGGQGTCRGTDVYTLKR